MACRRSWYFQERICHFLCKSQFDLLPGCSAAELWPICPKTTFLHMLKQFYSSCPLCMPEIVPYIYWIVLINSICGLTFSVRQFWRLYYCSTHISIWRERNFRIPFKYIKTCRIIGSTITINLWLLLFIGTLLMNPQFMFPWVFAQSLMILFELILLLLDVFVGTVQLKVHTIVSFALVFINFYMVIWLQRIMLNFPKKCSRFFG